MEGSNSQITRLKNRHPARCYGKKGPPPLSDDVLPLSVGVGAPLGNCTGGGVTGSGVSIIRCVSAGSVSPVLGILLLPADLKRIDIVFGSTPAWIAMKLRALLTVFPLIWSLIWSSCDCGN